MPNVVSHEEITQIAMEHDLEHWIVNEDRDLNDEDELTELIETGSVTSTIAGIKYVVTLVFTEAK